MREGALHLYHQTPSDQGELPNPHFGTTRPMMLYLLAEIEPLAHRNISWVKND
jgi:hypothetical protein